MPRYTSISSVSFNRGLITESGELTFPENASVDELNCSLERTGNRRRRLAAKVDASGLPSSETYTAGQVVTTLSWENVGGNSDIEFAVVQIGNQLRFYDKSYEILGNGEVPISDNDGDPYILNLSTYNRPGGSGASQAPIQVASVKGHLVVASPEINTIYISRSSTDNSFTVTEIDFKVRDYSWLGDTSAYYSDATYDSSDIDFVRFYDSMNAGWDDFYVDDTVKPLSTYTTGSTLYPKLTIPWFAAKNASDEFAGGVFREQYGGTSLIGNGHFILGLYEGDRQQLLIDREPTFGYATQLADISTEVTNKPETTRFSTVAAYAGRVFYAGMSSEENSSRVFYTQTLSEIDKLGNCHSVNDPTAEHFSDRLDTDGGYVDIEEAYGISVLYPVENSLMIFAANGVWILDGVDGVFRSTEYRLSKASNVGISSSTSFGVVDSTPFWWSPTGIYTFKNDPVGGMQVEDLSRQTIQDFWNNIDEAAKSSVISEVDETEKRIFWFYQENSETVSGKLNRVLVFDTVLQAFYPWSISDKDSSNVYIIGTSFYRNSSGQEVQRTVIDNSGNTVVDGANSVVDTSVAIVTGSGTKLKILCYQSDGTIAWGEFSGTDFLDWGSANYSSYAESRHDLMGDLILRKTSPYIVVYLGVTETGWEASGDGYVPVRGSSCKVSAYWDWKTTAAATAEQAYRLKFTPAVDTGDLNTFGYPFTVNQTRIKLRGRGRSVRVRFESEQGKDFNIIGWGMVGAVNDRY